MRFFIALTALCGSLSISQALTVHERLHARLEADPIARQADNIANAKNGQCRGDDGRLRTVVRNETADVTFTASDKPISARQGVGPNWQWLDSNKNVNDCGDSSFINRASGGSPFVADCRCLQRIFEGSPGRFAFKFGNPRWYAPWRCGHCGFGFHTENLLGSSIGNEDIVDLMRDTIARYTFLDRETRTAAEGMTRCGPFQTSTYWALTWS